MHAKTFFLFTLFQSCYWRQYIASFDKVEGRVIYATLFLLAYIFTKSITLPPPNATNNISSESFSSSILPNSSTVPPSTKIIFE